LVGQKTITSIKYFLYTYGPYIGVFALALIIRLVNLARPYRMTFDEAHYVPDAVATLKYGHEVRWFDDTERTATETQEQFELLSPYSMEYASSHPPFGKILISLGMIPFDYLDSYGWRLSSAISGALISVLVMVLAYQIFGDKKISTVAGIFTALSNFNLAMSSIALLDIFLSLFVLIGIIFTVAYLKKIPDKPKITATMIAAAVFFGLAGGIKWSAAYYAAAVALIILIIEFNKYLKETSFKDKVLISLKILGKNIIVGLTIMFSYIAVWIPHLINYRLKQEPNFAEAVAKIIEWHTWALSALSEITAPHNNSSKAQEWLWLARPTSMFFLQREPQEDYVIISTLPNLILALLAFVGIIALTVYGIRSKNILVLMLPTAVAAGWIPWLFYQDRTIFFFYVIVFEPYLIIAAAWLIYQFRQRLLRMLIGGMVLAYSLFFLPISVGLPVEENSMQYNLQGNWSNYMIKFGLYDTDQLSDDYYNEMYSSGYVDTSRTVNEEEPSSSVETNSITSEQNPNAASR